MTWYKDVEHGVYWEQDGENEQLAREEFVEPNFAFAAVMLGTTEEALRNAEPKPVPPTPKAALE